MSGSRSPPFVSPRPRLSCEQLHDDEEEEEEDEDDEGDEGDEGARARSTPKLHSGLFSSFFLSSGLVTHTQGALSQSKLN